MWNAAKGSLEGHWEGLLAESAVAKLFGIKVDEEIYKGGDNGTDLVLPNGDTAQVKYRGQRDWDFALNNASLDSFKTDIGILVWPTEDERDDAVDVVGYVTKEQFAERAFRSNYTRQDNGWRLAIQQKDMQPVEELLGVLIG